MFCSADECCLAGLRRMPVAATFMVTVLVLTANVTDCSGFTIIPVLP